VTTRANLKYIEVKIPTYGQSPFQPAELQCPGSNGCGPVTTRTGFLRGRDQEIHVSCAGWGIGRFEKIGIIYPYLSAPFVGIVETVCGLLLIFGLFSRPAALLLLIDISVAILTTKVPLTLHKGFWPGEAEARADYSMFMSTLFLLIVGAGALSLDAWWDAARRKSSHNTHQWKLKAIAALRLKIR